MPLLALDKKGRLYQTSGLGDHGTDVGYYADENLGHDSNVYFGEDSAMGNARMKADSIRKMQKANKIRKAQMAHQRKMQAAQKQQQIVEMRKVKAVKAKEDNIRRQKAAKHMRAVRSSKNIANNMHGQFMGNPMEGFKHQGQALMTAGDFKSAELSGDYEVAQPFGNTMLGEYEMDDNSEYDTDGTMGFSLKKAFKKATKSIGKIAQKANPLSITAKLAKQIPIVKDVYKGVDKITGGTLTSIVKISDLPARAVQGQKISKAEFMEAAMMAFKVGAIVATGGAASAVIAAGAGTLKNGPLGKTSFGRALLTGIEIATLAAAAGQTIQGTLEKEAQKRAEAMAQTEVGKRTGVIGQIALTAGAAAYSASGSGDKASNGSALATSANADKAAQQAAVKVAEEAKKGTLKVASDAALKAAQEEAMKKAKQAAAKTFEEKTGVPLDLATKVATGKTPSPEEIKQKAKETVSKGLSEAKEKLAKIMNSIPQSEPQMKAMVEAHAKALEQEIKERVQLVTAIQEEEGQKLLAANNDLIAKLQVANKAGDETAALRKQYDSLAAEFNRAGATINVKDGLSKQMNDLQKKLAASQINYDKLADLAWIASEKCKDVEGRGIVRVAQADVSPYGKSAGQFAHPLLSFG